MREPEAEPLLDPIPERDRYETWHLVEVDGRSHSRGEGAIALAELLPRFAPLARLARWLGLVPVVAAGYAIVSRNRGRLGRLVPDGAPPRRYP